MILSRISKLLTLGLLSAQTVCASEAEQEVIANEGSPEGGTSSALAVKVTTSFPDAEIFGVKLVNGHSTSALLSFTNNEPMPVSVRVIGGTLWTTVLDQPSRILRNFTPKPFDTSIPPGQSESLVFKFTTDMHPQDARLNLNALVMSDKGLEPIVAFNETVSIVEAPSSVLDPQNIFLYLVLAGFFGAIAYGVYSYWIVTLFPQQKKRPAGKGGERAKTSSKGSKKVDPSEQISVPGADGAAVTSKGYDEAWIPQQHLKRPESKRIKSGTPSGVKTKKA